MSPTLLVFGDSLSFHGPSKPMPSDDTRLWPNVAAAELGGRAHLFAGAGWTARDAFWALTGDPNVWAVLPTMDVLVLAVGSMDTLPSPLPSYLRGGLRYLRPDRLRRLARTCYLAALPFLARFTGGRPVALPPHLTVRYLDDTVTAVRALRPDFPVVAILPATHRAASYGYVHTGHGPGCTQIRKWAAGRDIPVVDLAALTADHVRNGHGNPDGMHWGWAGHEAVGRAMAATIGKMRDTPRCPGEPAGPEP
jgi:diglucosylglycerate octanoyltransferase